MYLDEQQRQALGLALSGQNLCITGGAGTGKTHSTRFIASELQQAGKNVVILAATGLAAFNAGGQTIHSFFGFKDNILHDGNISIVSKTMLKKLQAIDTLIIDEISMCRADIFAAMDRMLKLANNNKLPFSEKQILVIGDYYQIPPVVPNEFIKDYLYQNFNGIFAFNTEAWAQANFSVVNLVNIYRQSDINYLNMLNDIRTFSPNAEKAISAINCYCQQLNAYQHDDFSHINICTHNIDADNINLRYLSELPGDEHIYSACTAGDLPDDFNPVSRNLKVKIGARVMLLKNSINHSNGSMGYITDLSPKSITVKLDYGNTVHLTPAVFEYKEYELEGDSIIAVTKGTISQYPLALSYAISSHKSQGMGFDRAMVVTGTTGCFEQGQIYTILSRLTSLSGLRLTSPIQLYEALPDPTVKAFYDNMLLQPLNTKLL